MLSENENAIATPARPLVRVGSDAVRRKGSAVRIGLMIGPERGRYRDKVAEARRRRARRPSRPASPRSGCRRSRTTSTRSPRSRSWATATTAIELGTAVMPIQTRHPIAMAQQALANQAVCEGRFTLGLGPSHHWIVEDMLGLPYDQPARQVRNYLEVLNVAFAGPGPGRRRERRLPRAQRARRHRHRADADPRRRARAGDAAHRGRARRRARSSGWPTSARSATTSCPRITKAAGEAGRPSPRVVAGVPGRAVRATTRSTPRATWANRALGHAEYSPNYQRLLEHGDATDVGDLLAAGDESAVVERLQQLPRRRRHRPRGARAPARHRPRRPHRVPEPHARPSSPRCARRSDSARLRNGPISRRS